jgi:hypothetical protein
MERRYRIIRMILLFLLFAPLAIFIFGTLVMWLWNNTLVPVLHVSEVSFWQALGILVLSKILFGSFGGGGYRRYPTWKERMTQKWNRMTPEEREKFKEKWKGHWWKMGYKPWDSESGPDQIKP